MTPPNAWDDQTKKLVEATVGKDLNRAGLALLQHLCLSKGLDPLANEIYMVQKGDGFTPIVSINGMQKLCAQLLDGFESSFFDADGNSYPVWLKNEKPAACQVKVYRKGATRPFVVSCRMVDYDTHRAMWKKMPARMIEKVATAGALRLGFSDLLSGLYSQEEMDQSGMIVNVEAVSVTEDPSKNGSSQIGGAKPNLINPSGPDTAEAAKESDINEIAENLANSMNGTVVETTDPAPQRTVAELQTIGKERGLTDDAIKGIIEIIQGDIEKGIKGIQQKTPDQIKILNERYSVKAAVKKW